MYALAGLCRHSLWIQHQLLWITIIRQVYLSCCKKLLICFSWHYQWGLRSLLFWKLAVSSSSNCLNHWPSFKWLIKSFWQKTIRQNCRSSKIMLLCKCFSTKEDYVKTEIKFRAQHYFSHFGIHMIVHSYSYPFSLEIICINSLHWIKCFANKLLFFYHWL